MNRRIDQIENELRKMKKELTVATDAGEKSRIAMDDLASVLREVSSEAREKLKSTQAELKASNAENEQLKVKLRSANERLSSMTVECNKRKNEVERLRMEADETFATWSEKESGLVECMKKVEEERTRAQAKNSALQDEMRKLRDILKQAMAEAAGAKEAASLARAENSQLKDLLAEKDTALTFMSKELESLRLSEADARDTLKDSSTRDSNTQNIVQSLHKAVDHEQEDKKVRKAFSFDMRCTGKNRRCDGLVDEKALVRGGRVERQDHASNLKRNMSSRFPDQPSLIVDTERHQMVSQRQDSLSNKELVKGFKWLLGSRRSFK